MCLVHDVCTIRRSRYRNCSVCLRNICTGIMHALQRIHACIIKSRCFFVLLYNYDLNSFEPFCITGSSGWFSVLRPAKPAVRLCMHTIIYIVLVLICTGQLNLDCFESLCFSGCSTHLSVCRPRQPAICLTMCSILNTQIFITTDGDLNTFQALCLSGCSTHHTICNWVLPANRLDVSAVGDGNVCYRFLNCLKRITIFLCISFCIRTCITIDCF